MESVLNALHDLDYKMLSVSTLEYRLRENADLWEHEDSWVPRELTYRAEWQQFGHQEERAGSVPVQLPSALNAAINVRND